MWKVIKCTAEPFIHSSSLPPPVLLSRLFFSPSFSFPLFLPSSLPDLWVAGAEEQEAEARGTYTMLCTTCVQSPLTTQHFMAAESNKVNVCFLICLQVDSLSEEQRLLTEALRSHEPFCPIMHCSFASSSSPGLQPDSMAARSVWGQDWCCSSEPLEGAVHHDQRGGATAAELWWQHWSSQWRPSSGGWTSHTADPVHTVNTVRLFFLLYDCMALNLVTTVTKNQRHVFQKKSHNLCDVLIWGVKSVPVCSIQHD